MRSSGTPRASTSRSGGVLVVFIGLQLAQMMSALDATIVATALPTIADELGGFSRITWVVTAYALANVASMPIYGKLGDLYGRKTVLLSSIAVFLVASVLCGGAQTLNQLLVARFLQGIGAGGLGTLSMAVLADIVPARQLGRWMGYQGVMYAASSVAGPLVGGVFVQYLSWRWAFIVNVPMGLVAGGLIATRLPGAARHVKHAIDWLGSALLVAALSVLMLVATLAGSKISWAVSALLGLVVVALGALFVWREVVAPEPVLPLRLLSDGVIRVSTGLNMTSGMLLASGIFFVPMFVQEVGGVSPTAAGLTLMPLMLGAAVGTLVAGAVVERTGRIRPWPIAGTVLMTVGVALLATIGLSTSVILVGGWALALGLGVGFVMQPSLLASQNAAPMADMGVTTSTTLVSRSLGSTMGVPIFAGILNAGLAGRAMDPAGFAHAIPFIFLTCIPIGVASIGLALALVDRPLREGALDMIANDPLAGGALDGVGGPADPGVAGRLRSRAAL